MGRPSGQFADHVAILVEVQTLPVVPASVHSGVAPFCGASVERELAAVAVSVTEDATANPTRHHRHFARGSGTLVTTSVSQGQHCTST